MTEFGFRQERLMDDIQRNIFNQYSKAENRVTHALGHTVASNKALTEKFVHFLLGRSGPHGYKVQIQKLPWQTAGSHQVTKGADGTRPDLWIYNKEAEFACVIENKLTAEVEKKQLFGHVKTAKERGFSDITIVAVTPAYPQMPKAVKEAQDQDASVLWRKWPELHSWLSQWADIHKGSWLVRQFCEFLQLTEEELVKEGKDVKLIEFPGIPFSKNEPYEYLRAKNLLRALTQFLRESETLVKAYPNLDLRSGRGKITERENLVWDFISLEPSGQNFTKHPHLTVVIRNNRISFQLTIPNAAPAKFWKVLKRATDDDWQGVFLQILQNVSRLALSPNKNSPQPYLEVLHRHFPGQAVEPVDDGRLFFSLDSVMERSSVNPHVKVVPAWKDYLQALIKGKQKANIQLAVGIQYYYRDYQDDSLILRQADFKNQAVEALRALKPFQAFLYDLI